MKPKIKIKKPTPVIERSILFHQIHNLLLDNKVTSEMNSVAEVSSQLEELVKEKIPLDKEFQVLEFDMPYVISKSKKIEDIKLGYKLKINLIPNNEGEWPLKVLVTIHNDEKVIREKVFLNNNFAHKWINHNFSVMLYPTLKMERELLKMLIRLNNNGKVTNDIKLFADTHFILGIKNNSITCIHGKTLLNKYNDFVDDREPVVKNFDTLEAYFKYIGKICQVDVATHLKNILREIRVTL